MSSASSGSYSQLSSDAQWTSETFKKTGDEDYTCHKLELDQGVATRVAEQIRYLECGSGQFGKHSDVSDMLGIFERMICFQTTIWTCMHVDEWNVDECCIYLNDSTCQFLCLMPSRSQSPYAGDWDGFFDAVDFSHF